MFNEKDKLAFVETISNDNSRKAMLTKFAKIEPAETKAGRDFCKFSLTECCDAIRDLSLRSALTVNNYIQDLRRYCEWQTKRGVIETNPLLGISSEEIDTAYGSKNYLVKDPIEMNKIITCIDFDSIKNQSVNVIYQAILWLSYLGITLQDIGDVKKTDVDIENRVINFKGRRYIIYDEAMNIITTMCAMDSATTSRYRQDNLLYFFPAESADKFIRFPMTTKFVAHSIKKRILQFNNESIQLVESGFKIFVKYIFLSGCFYRFYQEEQNGTVIDSMFMSEYRNKYPELKNKFTVRTYDDWKQAFWY